jgi:hypothetical protein
VKYTKDSDKKQDAKTTKGLDKEQKAMFEKMDKKHRKPKSQEDDRKMDVGNVVKLKRAHEKEEVSKLGPQKEVMTKPFFFIIAISDHRCGACVVPTTCDKGLNYGLQALV